MGQDESGGDQVRTKLDTNERDSGRQGREVPSGKDNTTVLQEENGIIV